MDPKSIVRDGYDRLGDGYRDWSATAGDTARRWFLSEVLPRIPSGSDVLELGCGPGVDAVQLAAGRRYVGVDISRRMISLARARVPMGTFIEHDLATLERPKDSADAVVAIFVFGHLPPEEHLPTLARIFGWLRSDGLLCASFPLGAGHDVEEDFIGVPMYFGGIGQAATLTGLRDIGFAIELAETRDDPDESFLWVIARKPSE
jgi:SAM-dependent methyltransferase